MDGLGTSIRHRCVTFVGGCGWLWLSLEETILNGKTYLSKSLLRGEMLLVPDDLLREIVERIRACIGSRLEFIVLFGSAARGEIHPLSDIDVGVKSSAPEGERGDLLLSLAGLYDFDSRPRVDIVLLDTASLTLKYRVVRDGRLLFQRDGEAWPRFVEQVLSRYPDWKTYLDRYLAESVGV